MVRLLQALLESTVTTLLATTVPTATFTAGISTGAITLALDGTRTSTIPQGRYLYNVLISPGAGQTVYNIINGNIMIYTGISSTP